MPFIENIIGILPKTTLFTSSKIAKKSYVKKIKHIKEKLNVILLYALRLGFPVVNEDKKPDSTVFSFFKQSQNR